ncbi:unnamed protein product, partial [Prorocentrum cordatum]
VSLAEIQEQKRITLGSPNVAQTRLDDAGNWTMIYDEGFEVNVDGLSFFAFSKFDLSFGHVVWHQRCQGSAYGLDCCRLAASALSGSAWRRGCLGLAMCARVWGR